MLTKEAESLDRKVLLKEMDLFLKNLRIHRRAVADTPSRINKLELIRVNRLIKKFKGNHQIFEETKKQEAMFNKLKLYHYRIMEELEAVRIELEKHSSPVLDDNFYKSASLLHRKLFSIL